jgi:hypothetical protein
MVVPVHRDISLHRQGLFVFSVRHSAQFIPFIDPNYVGTPYNVTWARGSDSDPTEFYIESFIISQQVPIASSDKVLVQTNGATQGTVAFLQCNDQCVCSCVLCPTAALMSSLDAGI